MAVLRKLVPFLFVLAGCGPVSAVERGEALFSDPALSQSPSNVFSCATCHAAEPQSQPQSQPQSGDKRRPGYTLHGAAARPSFWGGEQRFILDAVNFCLAEFMRGDLLSNTEPDGLALFAYLRSLAPNEAEAARPLTLVHNIDDAYLSSLPAGDGQRGEAVYEAACSYCHGDAESGKGRLGEDVSIVPNDTVKIFGAKGARPVIAEKVRHGKFFGIGGHMPLYSLEALTDAELADLLRFLLP